jgi:Flp pilus assembly pilin Flp
LVLDGPGTGSTVSSEVEVVFLFLIYRRSVMQKVWNVTKRFFSEEKAAEVTELGIVLALIVAGCVVTIALIGPTIQKAYTDTEAALNP